jgi:hypothetical protein
MEIIKNKSEFDSYIKLLEQSFTTVVNTNEFNWSNINSILMLTIKRNWTVESSNSNYQINSESVKDFFPILQISDSFPHWRLSMPALISKSVLNNFSETKAGNEWIAAKISYRHKIQNGYPYLQLTLEDGLRNLKNNLKENDEIFFLREQNTSNYFVFASRVKIFNIDSILIVNPKTAASDKTVFKLDEIHQINSKGEEHIILSDKVLRQVIFESFKYILNKYGDETVLKDRDFKDSVIEDRKFSGMSLGNYFGSNTLIGFFESVQTSDQLKSSGTQRFINDRLNVLGSENAHFTSQWNGVENGKGLSLKNFNRLLSDLSDGHLKIINKDDMYQLVNSESISINGTQNIIYFGSPGTGKSHRADRETKGMHVKKVTFHPEYDYNSFVGGYKPTMNGEKISYKFVPQIFIKIYVEAWQNYGSGENIEIYYLQIEEINRGNCAEIFGDLFQLLDRDKEGFSKYEVTAEEELLKYLLSDEAFGAESEGIKDGKLKLPPNLKIIATMNTSDQSLFPMDSAFKRRWDWEYVPIDYKCVNSDFTILLNNGKSFKWLEFLKNVNIEIFNIDKNQDKQIGNWFINASNSNNIISESTFVNKVLFYLWNDVFKDEERTIFKLDDGEVLTYTSFFEQDISKNLVSDILEKRLRLVDIGNSEKIANVID